MSQRIQDMQPEDRPRERLLTKGPDALSDAELIGLFINTGVKGENAVQIARRLLRANGGLLNFSRQSTSQLSQEHGLGPAKAAVLAAAFELGKRAAREAASALPMATPLQVYNYIGQEMQALTHEEVHLLSLDAEKRLIHHDRLFRGTLNETTAHPREIMKHLILRNAHGFILIHNHPGGDPFPSAADITFTRWVKEIAQVLNYEFTDHIIIGTRAPERPKAWYSFVEGGLLG